MTPRKIIPNINAYHRYEEKVWVTFAPYAVLMVILGFLNIWLFVLPMAMRM